jgi:hypothetical protein
LFCGWFSNYWNFILDCIVFYFSSHDLDTAFVCLAYMFSAADFGDCHHGRCVFVFEGGGGGSGTAGAGAGAGIFFCPWLPNLLSRVYCLAVCRKLT